MFDWKKQALDQTAHFLIAFVVVGITWMLGCNITIPGGLFIGVVLGILREFSEPDPIDSKYDYLDIAFWALGGLVAGIIV